MYLEFVPIHVKSSLSIISKGYTQQKFDLLTFFLWVVKLKLYVLSNPYNFNNETPKYIPYVLYDEYIIDK